ncbi:MAG: DUF2083 domain-containing protein [Hyphomicrobiales bacterium]|nr:DUF2083 domain-containing protein [Hyphomicrobiales bacterium]MCP5371023.1 DUF2083 domain-containing protein [Hyphomicrobiales bacterium]
MAKNVLLGGRLRRLRRERGLSQVNLADKLGISASYLNLIEHNRRSLTVPLLLRLSQILNVDPQIFSPQQEGQLIGEITEALNDPLHQDLSVSEADIGQMVADAPDLCHAMAKTYTAYRTAQGELQVMTERLAQDPILSGSAYRLRTLLTSIRSFSEILHDNIDLDPEERRSFLRILLDESENLTETVTDMLGILGGDGLGGDGLGGAARNPSPGEAVADFVQRRGNHFADLETVAGDLRRAAGLEGAVLFPALADYLGRRHGVTVEIGSGEALKARSTAYDEGRRHLLLSRALAPSSLAFHLARLVAHLEHGDLLDSLARGSELPTEKARAGARAALARYFAAACLMPYDPFLEAAEDSRYDVEELQHRFGAGFEQVAHRLTGLRRPGAEGIPLHLIRVDIAGNISKRFSASGLRIPRYGSPCPRWIVHGAFLSPGQVRRQVGQMPDGSRYFSIARTVTKPSLGHAQPKSHFSVCIGCEISDMGRMAYADGLNVESAGVLTPVGVACHLCPRTDCAQRAGPPPPEFEDTPARKAAPAAEAKPAYRGAADLR